MNQQRGHSRVTDMNQFRSDSKSDSSTPEFHQEQNNKYELQLIDQANEFQSLCHEWDDFLSNCEADHPFNTHEWLQTWWLYFGDQRPVKIIVVRCGGRMVCCIPITYETKRIQGLPLRYARTWINTHSFRSGILCDKNHYAALEKIASHLAATDSWDVLDFNFLPVAGSTHARFQKALGDAGLRYATHTKMSSPVLNVTGNWDEWLAGRSKSKRENIRRKHRKLVEKMGARIDIVSGVRDDLQHYLEQCWQVSAKTWKHRQGSSIAADKSRSEFYQKIAASDKHWIVIGMLYLDSEPIAFEYNILYKGTLYNMKLGYDEEYRKLSPGWVLRIELVKWVFENNIRAFDYMGYAAGYKNDFSNGELGQENMRVYSYSMPANYIHAYEMGIKPVLRKIKHSVVRAFSEGTGE